MLVSHLREQSAGVEGWYDRLEAGLNAFFQLLSEEPAFTHCLAIESFAAGPDAQSKRRAALVAGFAEVYRRANVQARKEDPRVVELELEACRAIAGGARRGAARLRRRRPRSGRSRARAGDARVGRGKRRAPRLSLRPNQSPSNDGRRWTLAARPITGPLDSANRVRYLSRRYTTWKFLDKTSMFLYLPRERPFSMTIAHAAEGDSPPQRFLTAKKYLPLLAAVVTMACVLPPGSAQAGQLEGDGGRRARRQLISGEAGRWQGNSVDPTLCRRGTDRACKLDATGLIPTYDNSSVYLGESTANGCRRSDVSEILTAGLAEAQINIACSGAHTANIWRASQGGEVVQGRGAAGRPARGDRGPT